MNLIHETDTDVDLDRAVLQLIEARVMAQPDAPAIETGDGEVISYGALWATAGRVRARLEASGVREGDFVGVLDHHSELSVLAVIGVLRAGAVFVPLDGRWPPSRLIAVAGQVTLAAVIVSPELEGLTAEVAEVDAASLGAIVLPREWDGIASSLLPSPVRDQADHPVYAIFTSGSTGVPKGVLIGNASVVNLIEWVRDRYRIGPGERLLWVTSLTFDLSMWDLLGGLSSGATICVPAQGVLPDPGALGIEVASRSITFWNSAPALMGEVLATDPPQSAELRHIFLSGDWVPLTMPTALARRYPRSRLTVLGGATEATVWSTYTDVEDVDPEWPSIPYGRPIANTRLYIVDDAGNEVLPGDTGEMLIAGVGVALGYLANEELSEARFRTDTIHSGRGGRLYATGDLSLWLPEGTTRFLGRRDDQVKISGYRIELGDVRSALARIPGVTDVAVVANETRTALSAVVSFEDGMTLDRFRAQAATTLPTYMLPAEVIVVPALPSNANGKVDLDAVRALAAGRAPGEPFDLPELDAMTNDWEPASRGAAAIIRAALAAPSGTYGLGMALLLDSVNGDDIRAATQHLIDARPELTARFATVEGEVIHRVGMPHRDAAVDVAWSQGSPLDDPTDAVRRAWHLVSSGVMFSVQYAASADRSAPATVFVFAHHALVDGHGFRMVLDEFLQALYPADRAQPEPSATRFAAASSTVGDWQKTVDALDALDQDASAVIVAGTRSSLAQDLTVTAGRLAAAAAASYVTPTALVIALVREAAGRVWQWRLRRVTVPMSTAGSGLLTIEPLPVISIEDEHGTIADAAEREAERLFDAIDQGVPPSEQLSTLASSLAAGLDDCLISVDDQAPFEHARVLQSRRPPPAGSPGVLTVAVDQSGLSASGVASIFSVEDLARFVAAIGALLDSMESGQPEQLAASSEWSPLPHTAQLGTTRADQDEPVSLSTVLDAWSTFFGKPVSPDEHYFDLGASSIVLAQLMTRLRSTWPTLPISIRTVYATPTPRTFARWLDSVSG